MATAAIRTQCLPVNVGMALAALRSNVGELQGAVTLPAVHVPVLAGQRKTGGSVVKGQRFKVDRPTRCGVTVQAIGLEPFSVGRGLCKPGCDSQYPHHQ